MAFFMENLPNFKKCQKNNVIILEYFEFLM